MRGKVLNGIWSKLRELFTVAQDSPEFARARYGVFVKQIPLLYFILSVNTLAMVYTFAGLGPRWLTLDAPSALVAICVARGVVWSQRADQEITAELARKRMAATAMIGALLAALVSLWGLALYGYGDAYDKGQVVFFLGLTMIACSFCLTHLLPAALSVMVIGGGPCTAYFLMADHGHFRAAAANLALVALGVAATNMRNHSHLAGLIAAQRDLTRQHAETLRLAHENSRLANLDPLTGLANRRMFIARLTEICDDPQSGQVAIAFIDLDGFKHVNDEFGHEVGDTLLACAAKALAERAPEGGLVARLGGDEFAALLGGCDAEAEMLRFGAAAHATLLQAMHVGARSVRVGASVGVAAAVAGRLDAHELLRRADVAMYQAKASGKGVVLLYEPELDLNRRRLSQLSAEIRAGLDHGEFEVFYQPIVDARTMRLTSVEALLRWPRRPTGPLGPDVFIPAAEAEGLIDALGLFALRRACEDLRAFDGVAVSVNVSPAQFRDTEFEAKVAAILHETGFPAPRLNLEVTEGYLIDNPQRAAEVISALKRMGASVVLDDFGTGYTSIAYLQKYGFSGIKIDRELSSRIGEDEKARVLVTGVVYLANGLDMPVTAEGVETDDQARLLRLAGCKNLQGFRFSRPKPIRELLADDLRPERAPATA